MGTGEWSIGIEGCRSCPNDGPLRAGEEQISARHRSGEALDHHDLRKTPASRFARTLTRLSTPLSRGRGTHSGCSLQVHIYMYVWRSPGRPFPAQRPDITAKRPTRLRVPPATAFTLPAIQPLPCIRSGTVFRGLVSRAAGSSRKGYMISPQSRLDWRGW